MRRRQEEGKARGKKSKSQFRAARPPMPASKKNSSNNIEVKQTRRVGNIRTKRSEAKYNTDIEDAKRQSKIPRLSQASVDRIPQPKKYIPESEYKSSAQEEKRKRSQSYAQKVTKSSKDEPRNRKIVNSAAKPVIQQKVNTRRSVNYKPYTLREYKDLENKNLPQTDQPFPYKTRGGLGADIGGEEWKKQHDKRQRMKEFANRVKHQHQLAGDGMRRTSQTQNVENREK